MKTLLPFERREQLVQQNSIKSQNIAVLSYELIKINFIFWSTKIHYSVMNCDEGASAIARF